MQDSQQHTPRQPLTPPLAKLGGLVFIQCVQPLIKHSDLARDSRRNTRPCNVGYDFQSITNCYVVLILVAHATALLPRATAAQRSAGTVTASLRLD